MNDSEREQLMDDMRSFDEPMPQIGIFWYNPENKSLFGVRKQEITPKHIEDAAARGIFRIAYECLSADQTRDGLFGRVAWNTDKFIVLVDQWAKPIENQLSRLIEQEFALPYFEFVYE